MNFDTSTWMMIAFVIALGGGIWKVYAFMPTKTLADDDTGEDAHEHLVSVMHKVLEDEDETPTLHELHQKMTNHEHFDKERHWRFNPNKLNQLLNKHYIKNPHLNSIEDIHKNQKKKESLSTNINITLEKESKIATLELEKPLSKDDFLFAKSIIDPFIEQNGKLNGIIIYTKDFPYWNSFSGFISHMKFIKNHHQDVKKLAFVTDSFVGEVGEHVGSHFVSAEVKNFDFDSLKEAKEWIVSTN
jgi:hypothetical protein